MNDKHLDGYQGVFYAKNWQNDIVKLGEMLYNNRSISRGAVHDG